jgi:hypothetical protein
MKCPFCSEEIKEDAKKCRFCGEWLTKDRNVYHATAEKKGKPDLKLYNFCIIKKEESGKEDYKYDSILAANPEDVRQKVAKQQQFEDPWLSVSRFPEIWLFLEFAWNFILGRKRCKKGYPGLPLCGGDFG